eukprot:scaffold260221_cov22-Tisochrysis_lutea.AAC.1
MPRNANAKCYCMSAEECMNAKECMQAWAWEMWYVYMIAQDAPGHECTALRCQYLLEMNAQHLHVNLCWHESKCAYSTTCDSTLGMA